MKTPFTALVLLLALLAAPAFAKTPRPAAAAPPPVEEPVDDPPPPDEPDPFAEPELPPEELPPARPGDHRDGGKQSLSEAFMEGFREGMAKEERRQGKPPGSNDLTDDEAAAVGLVSICCCLLFFLALVGLIVWLVVRSKKASAAPAAAPYPAPPGASPADAPAGGTHLSVVAVAFDARVRNAVEGALRSAGASASPMNPESRATLVRTLCRALLDISGNWRAFGYGDKTDFANDAAAEQSFRAAWSDFRGRCHGAGDTTGELCVVVLVLCSRGAVLGTSKLDDPVQARALLQHRMGLATASLLAADCFFAPPDAATALSSGDAYRRFPEMQPLGPG